jgi:hypothetical protein
MTCTREKHVHGLHKSCNAESLLKQITKEGRNQTVFLVLVFGRWNGNEDGKEVVPLK